MRDYVILLLFLLLPFAFIAPGLLHAGHHLFFVLSALVIIAMLCDNKWISLFLIYIALWQLWLFIKVLYFPQVPTRQTGEGFSQIVFALSAACVFVAVKKSKIKIEWFYDVICVTAIIQSLLAIAQMWNCDPIVAFLGSVVTVKTNFSSTTIVGTLSNPNFLAAYLVISFPFFLRIRKPYYKPSWCWFIPVILFLLIVSKTSTAVVALSVGMCVYCGNVRIKGTRMWFFLMFGGIGYLWYDEIVNRFFTGDQLSPRFQFWWNAIENMDSLQRVVFGLGPAAPKTWEFKCPLHNEWLTIFYQYGLVGLSLFIGFIVTLYRGNKILFSALIIILVNMLGNYPLHLAPSAFLIIIIVGLMHREKEASHA